MVNLQFPVFCSKPNPTAGPPRGGLAASICLVKCNHCIDLLEVIFRNEHKMSKYHQKISPALSPPPGLHAPQTVGRQIPGFGASPEGEAATEASAASRFHFTDPVVTLASAKRKSSKKTTTRNDEEGRHVSGIKLSNDCGCGSLQR